MLYSTLVLALAVLLTSHILPALCAPVEVTSGLPTALLSKRLIENSDWKLSKMQLFTADPGPDGISSFQFTFEDTNEGLNLKTTCNRSLVAGATGNCIDAENYYPCANSTVSYMLGDGRIDIKRHYIDPSLGDSPQWWQASAFGHATINFTSSLQRSAIGGKGTMKAMKLLDVAITELSSRKD